MVRICHVGLRDLEEKWCDALHQHIYTLCVVNDDSVDAVPASSGAHLPCPVLSKFKAPILELGIGIDTRCGCVTVVQLLENITTIM